MHGKLEPEERVMDLKNFTVYSKVGCPYCTKIVEVLELAKLSHVIYTLDKDFNRPSFYGEFGEGTTFPQIVLNGKKLGGCNETVKYLRENNLV
tara:strand:- start:417 stop:695 length:279 start_codon:yes stop_codon:yes gene_type:complete